jgi:hypothetical protein
MTTWRTPRGASVTGHNPEVGQAAHQASEAGQVDAGMVDRQLVTKATHWVPEPFWVMPACRTPKPDSDPPGPLLETHRTVRAGYGPADG